MTQLEILKQKLLTLEQLPPKLAYWRFHNQKIVFTNGVFDLLHRGHIEYLAGARDLGDVLIIGLNSDASVKLLGKPATRPLQDEQTRATILAALRFVDGIVLFEEETPYNLIAAVQPDVLVKGGDYKVEEIAGHDIVQARGGEVALMDFVAGHSTTNLENKLNQERDGEG